MLDTEVARLTAELELEREDCERLRKSNGRAFEENVKLTNRVFRAMSYGFCYSKNPSMRGTSLQACFASWNDQEDNKDKS